MDNKTLLQEIKDNILIVAQQSTPLGASLWKVFLDMHPADMAVFLDDVPRESARILFVALSQDKRLQVFKDMSDGLQVYMLSKLNESEVLFILNSLQADELTDLFDFCSDEELRMYMNLLNKSDRERVLSLMKFHPESAGGIMNPDVLSLKKDFTVDKTIRILQRLKPDKDIYQSMYVTDNNHRLLGRIDLQDLVLHSPQERIYSFMKKNEFMVSAEDDREIVAHQMVHYGVTHAPVISPDGIFLGVVPADTLADILVEEAGEDVQRISAMTPLKQSYFETPFFQLLYERSGILIILLLVGSISSTILDVYQSTLGALLFLFVPMITGTGGNTSSQTSALAIQGLAAGDIRNSNMLKFLFREMRIGMGIGFLLSVAAFFRVYLTTGSYFEGFAISLALGLIVMLSVVLGSLVPLILKRLNIDPAYSAGPFLATAMDILGVLIYCTICRLVLV